MGSVLILQNHPIKTFDKFDTEFLLAVFQHSYWLFFSILIGCFSAFLLVVFQHSYWPFFSILIGCFSAFLLVVFQHSYCLFFSILIGCFSAFLLPVFRVREQKFYEGKGLIMKCKCFKTQHLPSYWVVKIFESYIS